MNDDYSKDSHYKFGLNPGDTAYLIGDAYGDCRIKTIIIGQRCLMDDGSSMHGYEYKPVDKEDAIQEGHTCNMLLFPKMKNAKMVAVENINKALQNYKNQQSDISKMISYLYSLKEYYSK